LNSANSNKSPYLITCEKLKDDCIIRNSRDIINFKNLIG
jgi:hypothetical protein